MSAKFQGAVLAFQRVNPSNDGTIASPDNTGAAVFTQQLTIAGGATVTPTLANLPAGACLEEIRIIVDPTAVQGGATLAINLAGVQIGSWAFAATVAGTTAVSVLGSGITITSTRGSSWQNTGTSPAALTLQALTLAAGNTAYISTRYTVRNPDGSITPTGQGLSNVG